MTNTKNDLNKIGMKEDISVKKTEYKKDSDKIEERKSKESKKEENTKQALRKPKMSKEEAMEELRILIDPNEETGKRIIR